MHQLQVKAFVFLDDGEFADAIENESEGMLG